MKYPDFFDTVPKIILKDELSDFLGVFEGGIIEFSYTDVVKSAGHSCPTIAGAYLMTLRGLKTLYGADLPQRGGIKAAFGSGAADEVTGVIANAVENITGATEIRGFKGIGGRFVRHSLMSFHEPVDSSVRFTRIDTGACVDVWYTPGKVAGDPRIGKLMPKVLEGHSSPEEKVLFGSLWQKRVRSIFARADEVIRITSVKG